MKALTLSLLLFIIVPFQVTAQLSVSEIFSSNMVIQRDQPIRVWGWAEKGKKVSVMLGQKTGTTKADKNGEWMVQLPARSSGGPITLKITSGKENLIFDNILVGDVWLCSGQSNMEWIVAQSNNAEEEIRNSSHPTIRHFKVPHGWSKDREHHLEGGPWQIAGPETTGNFTAVGYFFARELQKDVNVPIGLLNSSWGGSRIEPWMRPESLTDFMEGDIDAYLDKKEQERKQEVARLEAKVLPLPAEGEFEAAMEEDYDDSKWSKIDLPVLWEQAGYVGMDGTAWARKVIELSDEEAGSPLSLHLAMVDDTDWTYVNGEMVGSMGVYNEMRVYEVDPSVLKAGSNVILVKIEDTGGGGGLYGPAEELYYISSTGNHSLAGAWRFRVEKVGVVSAAGFRPNQTATVLYNKMIHPILDFPIKGVLWYQGESNASPEDAFRYRNLFKEMINDWRKLWSIGDFPFLWVQLANFMQADSQPTESSWAVLRESQSAALELPNTGEAVIIDIGEANDIHPRNKQDVGHRLSLAARKIAYGLDVVHSGPVFQSMKTDKEMVEIEFTNKGSGLQAKDKYGYVKGFAIAGSDKVFHWAKAIIKDDKLYAWSDEVASPQYVRYAWGNNPDDANLYNKEGLPARPFRTDQ